MDSVHSQLVVRNRLGIHARPAAMIVRLTNRHRETTVKFSKGDESANGKSIMEILMLAASQGTSLDVKIDGPDAHVLMKDLESLFENNFLTF